MEKAKAEIRVSATILPHPPSSQVTDPSWLRVAKVSNFHPLIPPGWRARPRSRRDRAARFPNGSVHRYRREDCDGVA